MILMPITSIRWLPLVAGMGAVIGGMCRSARADEALYTNDFNGPAGSTYREWSSSPIRYFNTVTPKDGSSLDAPAVTNSDSPNREQRYLGPFGGPRLAENTPDFNRTRVQQTISLKLEKLPVHKSVTVAFDLYVLSSWDGNNANYGPDRWSLAVNDGPVLLKTTFSNNPKTGAYDLSNQDYPKKDSRFQSRAAAVNTLGSKFFGDSTYNMSFAFDHTADELILNFSSDLFEGKGTDDEAWGLDNVKVVVHPEATPSGARRQTKTTKKK
jgi:hypothetical protein